MRHYRLIQAALGAAIVLFSPGASADTISLDFDTGHAARIIDVVTDESENRSLDIDWLADHPASQRWIARTKVHYGDATTRLFRKHLKRLAKGKDIEPDPFDLRKIKARAPEIRRTVQQFDAEDGQAQVRRLQEMLHPLLPATENLHHFHLSLVAGGREEAWWGEAAPPILYVNLAKASEPGGIRIIAAHHFYHALQRRFLSGNPEWKIDAMDGPTRVWAAAIWEGTAALAGDPRRTRSMAPYHLDMYEEYTANDALTDEMLRDFERLLQQAEDGTPIDFRRYHRDPLTALIDDRVVWVGYAMALALSNAHGEEIIPKLLQAGPLPFADAFLTLFEQQQPAAKYRNKP